MKTQLEPPACYNTLIPAVKDLSPPVSLLEKPAFFTWFKEATYLNYIGSIVKNNTPGSAVSSNPALPSFAPSLACASTYGEVRFSMPVGQQVGYVRRLPIRLHQLYHHFQWHPDHFSLPILLDTGRKSPAGNCLTTDTSHIRFLGTGLTNITLNASCYSVNWCNSMSLPPGSVHKIPLTPMSAIS